MLNIRISSMLCVSKIFSTNYRKLNRSRCVRNPTTSHYLTVLRCVACHLWCRGPIVPTCELTRRPPQDRLLSVSGFQLISSLESNLPHRDCHRRGREIYNEYYDVFVCSPCKIISTQNYSVNMKIYPREWEGDIASRTYRSPSTQQPSTSHLWQRGQPQLISLFRIVSHLFLL